MNERIKKLRKALGLTQQEFANKIGIKRNSLANYETGRNIPLDAILLSICREFNASEDWLRNGSGNMFKSETYTSHNTNQIINSPINERIKELRNTLKLTQQEFADRLGVKRNTVGQWECGINSLTNATIIFLCKEFNVSENWLRNGYGNMFKSETYTSHNANQIISGSINERIKELRNALNLSQSKFGEALGVTRTAVCAWENGRRSISEQTIISICREFNVNENWLRNGSGNMFLPEDNSNSDMCIDSTFLKLLSMLDVEQLNYIKGIVLGTLIANGKLTLEDLHNF